MVYRLWSIIEGVRAIVHLAVVAGVLLTFGIAPFAHRHDADPDHRHGGGEVHAHWPGDTDHDAPDGVGWEAYDSDSDARVSHWVAGDGKAPGPVTTAPEEFATLITPDLECAVSGALTPHNHGPPCRLRLHPRAPPI